MNNRDKMIDALNGLPVWNPDDESTSDLHRPVVKLFTPDANATWFLLDQDTSNPEDVRYFGLCDLGLGFPELGWVDQHSLMTVTGPFGLFVELDEHFEGTLEDGYSYVNRE